MTPNQQLENKDRYRAFLPYCEYRNVDKLIAEINSEYKHYQFPINEIILESKMNIKPINYEVSESQIKRIRELRFNQDMSIWDISKKLKISKSSVYKYVNAIAYKNEKL